MRIGLINEYFPPFAPGGAEWSTLHLAKGLASRGHRVGVITPNYGALPDREEIDGFTVDCGEKAFLVCHAVRSGFQVSDSGESVGHW